MNECKIVHDLWPLYLDDELSPESSEFIKNHIASCPVCRKLPRKPMELPADWEKVPAPVDDSAAHFLRRLRRSFYQIALAIGIGIVLIAGGTWYYGQWSTQQRYVQQQGKERRVFEQQVAALNEVSPPSEELLKRWGISHSERPAPDKESLTLNFNFQWQSESPVERLEINTSHWFDHNLLVDAKTGTPLQLTSSGWGGDKNGITGQVISRPLSQMPEKVIFKTMTLYAFLKNPEQAFLFDYRGGEAVIPLNREFSYQGIEFKIDTLKLNDKTFTVNYHQITPADQVGVFQLDFTFDDRLGNSSGGSPQLSVSEPKAFTIQALHSPSKHWALKVSHVIQVIPGISVPIDVKGGSGRV